eukprot:TRINITY_DN21850_c1_g2_i1.p1 TRINITY_DN21850_c1_g2~~TRINITY_DN21850_c1_g2_i1.p1  ORF type:complete len:553 (+),score=79.04 TRINITY_DN21850_c1_g2_i1:94-1659(+)
MQGTVRRAASMSTDSRERQVLRTNTFAARPRPAGDAASLRTPCRAETTSTSEVPSSAAEPLQLPQPADPCFSQWWARHDDNDMEDDADAGLLPQRGGSQSRLSRGMSQSRFSRGLSDSRISRGRSASRLSRGSSQGPDSPRSRSRSPCVVPRDHREGGYTPGIIRRPSSFALGRSRRCAAPQRPNTPMLKRGPPSPTSGPGSSPKLRSAMGDAVPKARDSPRTEQSNLYSATSFATMSPRGTATPGGRTAESRERQGGCSPSVPSSSALDYSPVRSPEPTLTEPASRTPSFKSGVATVAGSGRGRRLRCVAGGEAFSQSCVKNGQQVTVLCEDGAWAEVAHRDDPEQRGWIRVEHLRPPEGSAADEDEPAGLPARITSRGGRRLRIQPGRDQYQFEVAASEEVQALEVQTYWVLVRRLCPGDQIGWVKREHVIVRESGGPTPPVSPPPSGGAPTSSAQSAATGSSPAAPDRGPYGDSSATVMSGASYSQVDAESTQGDEASTFSEPPCVPTLRQGYRGAAR